MNIIRMMMYRYFPYFLKRFKSMDGLYPPIPPDGRPVYLPGPFIAGVYGAFKKAGPSALNSQSAGDRIGLHRHTSSVIMVFTLEVTSVLNYSARLEFCAKGPDPQHSYKHNIHQVPGNPVKKRNLIGSGPVVNFPGKPASESHSGNGGH